MPAAWRVKPVNWKSARRWMHLRGTAVQHVKEFTWLLPPLNADQLSEVMKAQYWSALMLFIGKKYLRSKKTFGNLFRFLNMELFPAHPDMMSVNNLYLSGEGLIGLDGVSIKASVILGFHS